MGNLLLVDSSFYFTLLSRRLDPLALLAESEDLFDFAVCPAIWVEVVRGRTAPSIRDRFEQAFLDMVFLADDARVSRRAARLGWQLERAGQSIPAPDLLIAAQALDQQCPLLTFDRHFERIPGLVLLHRLPL